MLDYVKDPALLASLGVTGFLSLIIWAALLVVKVFALIDSLRYSNNQYVSAGKRSRTLWLALTGASLAFHLITGPVSFINIAGTIASIIYLVDVRPALQQVSGRGGNRNMGPYGPW
ncbi:MAG: hypothetical protein QOE19_4014 [Actinomycetota bacterium]|nr:hypothetical protein [Actinomycetota bacterium]MDQ1666899.1 hypothetical protein [Actinomycetota bacterium]MDQ1669779.1 hypothetical protein [Actinomycetota bacterium]